MGWSRFEIVSAATQAAAHSVYLPNPSLALHNFPPSPKSAIINYEQFPPRFSCIINSLFRRKKQTVQVLIVTALSRAWAECGASGVFQNFWTYFS